MASASIHSNSPISVGSDLPSLIFTLLPFPQDDGGAIMDTSMIFITIKRIYIQTNVIYHPYCSKPISQVPALRPKDRLIENIWVVGGQLHWISSANGVFDGLTSGFIEQSKRWKALFVLNFGAELLIFDPVLAWVRRVRTSKNDLAITDSERVIRLSLGVNPNTRFLVEDVFIDERRYMWAMVVLRVCFSFMRHVLDR